jgi:hypothetical protein
LNVTLDRVISALVESKNEAADDVLLEAVKLGNAAEQQLAVDALFRRRTTHGLVGLVARFPDLTDRVAARVLDDVKQLSHAVREAGRSDRSQVRLAALKLIVAGRQGKLAYVLSENVHHTDEPVARAAVDGILELAVWVSTETRRLQRGVAAEPVDPGSADYVVRTDADVCRELLDQRPDIETAVARGIESHRGKHTAELVRAALLLCDWPGSRTLALLQSVRHGGQNQMVRRLQQPPAAEGVDAFLQAAAHGGLRANFATTFAHIEEAPVLDALLRRTHWLKDFALVGCVHTVVRGAWWTEAELVRDVSRRDSGDAARIGEWVAVSGVADVVQDERMEKLWLHAHQAGDFEARLRLLRIVSRRKRGTSVGLIKRFLDDTDERLVRMAVRELIRRKPPEYETWLMSRVASATDSVRKLIGRAVGQTGFDNLWAKYEKLDKPTRRAAGRAMTKLLPDAPAVLGRRMTTGPVEQRLLALLIVHDLNLAESCRESLITACNDPSAKVRSRAVILLGHVADQAPDALVEKLLVDPDARVRANAVEVLEAHHRETFIPLLIQRARAGKNRERANAIKVMHKMRMGAFSQSLQLALLDPRPEHRISAMWALRQTNFWALIGEVGRMAKTDPDLRVRRYALGVLKVASELVREQRLKAAG